MSQFPHVEYRDVDVHAGDVHIIHELSMQVANGDFLAVIGPNGSGKSTILRCLYRALRPSGGRIDISGRSITVGSLRDNARCVAALTQSSDMYLDFTVEDVVRSGRLPHRSVFGEFTAQDRRICAQAMTDAGIAHLRERSFAGLSGGEAQRVLIARAFAQRPEVLVLDEPTNHLDVGHQYGVLGTARRRGLTIVAALHDLNIAAQFCDVIVLVSGGRIVRRGIPSEVLTEDVIRTWFGIGCYIIQHPKSGVPQVIFDKGEDS